MDGVNLNIGPRGGMVESGGTAKTDALELDCFGAILLGIICPSSSIRTCTGYWTDSCTLVAVSGIAHFDIALQMWPQGPGTRAEAQDNRETSR